MVDVTLPGRSPLSKIDPVVVIVAIVVLGRWNPIGVAVAALLFGVANASQFLFQAMDFPLQIQCVGFQFGVFFVQRDGFG